jgi:hypothetical protein
LTGILEADERRCYRQEKWVEDWLIRLAEVLREEMDECGYEFVRVSDWINCHMMSRSKHEPTYALSGRLTDVLEDAGIKCLTPVSASLLYSNCVENSRAILHDMSTLGNLQAYTQFCKQAGNWKKHTELILADVAPYQVNQPVVGLMLPSKEVLDIALFGDPTGRMSNRSGGVLKSFKISTMYDELVSLHEFLNELVQVNPNMIGVHLSEHSKFSELLGNCLFLQMCDEAFAQHGVESVFFPNHSLGVKLHKIMFNDACPNVLSQKGGLLRVLVTVIVNLRKNRGRVSKNLRRGRNWIKRCLREQLCCEDSPLWEAWQERLGYEDSCLRELWRMHFVYDTVEKYKERVGLAYWEEIVHESWAKLGSMPCEILKDEVGKFLASWEREWHAIYCAGAGVPFDERGALRVQRQFVEELKSLDFGV